MDCAGTDHLIQALDAQVKRAVMPYKDPRGITCTTELPTTINGQIRRVDLRQRKRERKIMGIPAD
jgi:acyl-coenzyme A synthetase/AMP-(fatty) acid ligase